MAKKKHKAKNSQGNQAVSQRPRKKILGLDVRDLGAAIAAAVVSEIAQVAIQKSGQNSDANNPGNAGNAARKPTQSTFDSVKEAFTQNPVQHGASVLAGAVNQVNPSLGKLATAVKDATQTTGHSISDTVGDTVDATQYTTASTVGTVSESVGGTVDVMSDAVQVAIQEATEKVVSLFDENQATGKKSKKGKGKKKGKKKNKK